MRFHASLISPTAALITFACCLSPSAAVGGNAAERAIVRLQRQVVRAPRSAIRSSDRRFLLVSLRSARAAVGSGHRCRALRRLDALHAPIATARDSGRLRSSRAAVLDRRLDRLERRLYRSRTVRCAGSLARTGHTGPGAVTGDHPDQSVQIDPMIAESDEAFAPEPVPEGPVRKGNVRRVLLSPAPPGPQARVASAPESWLAGTEPLSLLTNVALPSVGANPLDASGASAGSVVVLTGNTYLAVSTASGAAGTFKRYAVPDLFVAGTKTPDGGLCCDQDVIYDARSNLFFWVIQTWCVQSRCSLNKDDKPKVPDANLVNSYILLAASPEDLAVTPTGWVAWQIASPNAMGGNGWWFDYPQLAVGWHALYLAANAIRPNDRTKNRTALIRFSTDEIRKKYDSAAKNELRSDLNFKVWQERTGMRWVGDVGATGYAFARVDSSTMTLAAVNETSSYLPPATNVPFATAPFWSFQDFDVDGTLDNCCTSATPSATLVGNTIWIAFGVYRANTEGGPAVLPQPSIRVERVSASTYKVTGESTYAITGRAVGFPALARNTFGEVAMAFTIGGSGVAYPSPAVAVLTGDTRSMIVAEGTAHPVGYRWGDYLRVRRAHPDARFFSASSYINTPSGSIPYYTQFGRTGSPALTQPDLTVPTIDKTSVAIANRSPVAAGPFAIRLTVTTPGGKVFSSKLSFPGLAGYGALWPAHVCFSAPVTVHAMADSSNQVVESTESNNDATARVPQCIS